MKQLELHANSSSFKKNSLKNISKKFHLPKIQCQLLDGRFMDYLPYVRHETASSFSFTQSYLNDTKEVEFIAVPYCNVYETCD